MTCNLNRRGRAASGAHKTLDDILLYAVPGAVHPEPAPNIAQNVDHSASTGSLDSSGDENRSCFRDLRLAGDLTVLVSQLFGNDATSPKACSDKFRRVPPAPLSATPRLKSLEVWIRAPEGKHMVVGRWGKKGSAPWRVSYRCKERVRAFRILEHLAWSPLIS